MVVTYSSDRYSHFLLQESLTAKMNIKWRKLLTHGSVKKKSRILLNRKYICYPIKWMRQRDLERDQEGGIIQLEWEGISRK